MFHEQNLKRVFPKQQNAKLLSSSTQPNQQGAPGGEDPNMRAEDARRTGSGPSPKIENLDTLRCVSRHFMELQTHAAMAWVTSVFLSILFL